MNSLASLKLGQAASQAAEKGATKAPGEPAPETSVQAVLPLSDLLQAFGSTEAGLSTAEAGAILERVGPNRINDVKRRSLLVAFIERFSNPLVLILLFAATVSAVTGDLPSFFVIVVIVLLSVVLDVTQEHQALNAAENLRNQVSISAKVLRDGEPIDIPAAEVVPGDIVVITAGDLVPADCRLVHSRDLYVDEALLTGEAYPTEKDSASPTAAAGTATTLPANFVFMGSSVVSGTGKAPGSRYRPQNPARLDRGCARQAAPADRLCHWDPEFRDEIVRATVFLVLFVVLINLLFHRPLLESFLFALALAVGLTPELLPMIVSVTLSRGAMRMAERHVIVKHLSAIDDLGSMDVFCSDKTGTLTEAHIKLIREVDLAVKIAGM